MAPGRFRSEPPDEATGEEKRDDSHLLTVQDVAELLHLSKKQFAKFSAFRVEFLWPPALTFAMKRQDEPQGKGCGQWLAAGINPVVYSNEVNAGKSGSLVGEKM